MSASRRGDACFERKARAPSAEAYGKWLGDMMIGGRLGRGSSVEQACSSGMARRNDIVMLCDGHHSDQIDQMDQIDQEPR
ncbi:MAG: hypothetical protein AUH12_01515 [Gemmatimonadetes bacterium 13_2_20CM_69_8]|nr:MAG: hypothetical protein AUH12_01515 [Gemmatimonadetes bacterium 13_2_20CM_69_8]